MNKASTGSELLDELLGGYEKGVVTTIYGPAGSGKTLLLLLAMTATPKEKKIIFVDTEGGFSVERLSQVCNYYKRVLERTTFLKPTNFEEQKEAFNKLKELVNSDVDLSLLLVDTLTNLYRVEMSSEDNYELNKDLAKQLRDLVEIARKKDIPVLVTAQVYADLEEKDKFNVVGGNIVRNMSKCLLELRKENNHRKLVVNKHRSIPERASVSFKIVQEGIERV